ncbi:hypothetical protein B0H17DRAFT_1150795 [Mycena rosella]|uniref:Uncharacterized protein n=1 Tax=Mycena rosella TaxID=1033263 RepID=A0AAD7BQQ1_MYCRO|nr:hypothetical protein B0H17DRAFT_1150795 [Mycena rosella]
MLGDTAHKIKYFFTARQAYWRLREAPLVTVDHCECNRLERNLELRSNCEKACVLYPLGYGHYFLQAGAGRCQSEAGQGSRAESGGESRAITHQNDKWFAKKGENVMVRQKALHKNPYLKVAGFAAGIASRTALRLPYNLLFVPIAWAGLESKERILLDENFRIIWCSCEPSATEPWVSFLSLDFTGELLGAAMKSFDWNSTTIINFSKSTIWVFPHELYLDCYL